MSQRSVAHHTFVIERRLKASPQRVFRAWSTPESKRRWAACNGDMVNTAYSLDFRPQGSETNRIVSPDGRVHLLQGHYLDIVADERIIYAYDIHVDGVRGSASLATVLFQPCDVGTRMIFTEQIAFLDGHYSLEDRIHGTEELFDRIALELEDGIGRH
ncbi:MAG TPA: SRPBCC family protein [Aliidongia sp.]|uniref:SRPBCC family protein n=1 Tax=Aliidongia sp. TaxID=1914230 RepID=UPI002DDD21CD|nr:SRPBCC family protein [Aliidongia sp.]HEV2678679.1 SRPBCC family protein [Aliidongia sp.]